MELASYTIPGTTVCFLEGSFCYSELVIGLGGNVILYPTQCLATGSYSNNNKHKHKTQMKDYCECL